MHEFSAIHSKLDQKQQSRGRKSTVKAAQRINKPQRINKDPERADASRNAGKACAESLLLQGDADSGRSPKTIRTRRRNSRDRGHIAVHVEIDRCGELAAEAVGLATGIPG